MKYGLVLEGGGARGAYHIGAVKALMENGIEKIVKEDKICPKIPQHMIY